MFTGVSERARDVVLRRWPIQEPIQTAVRNETDFAETMSTSPEERALCMHFALPQDVGKPVYAIANRAKT